jgi:hypothetical protein
MHRRFGERECGYSRALVSQPSAERRSRTEREPGPSATNREAQYGCRLRSVVSPLGPRKSGLPDLRRLTADLGQARDRCLAALARDTRDRWRANEPLAVVSTNDVKQRSLPRSRDAFRRPGLSFLFAPAFRQCFSGRTRCYLATPAIPFHPERGVDGAPTGHSFVLSRVRGATSEPCGAACPVANGTSLGAPPWRFSAGDRCRRLREWKTGAVSDLSASHKGWRRDP